jgi:hypothetical protein
MASWGLLDSESLTSSEYVSVTRLPSLLMAALVTRNATVHSVFSDDLQIERCAKIAVRTKIKSLFRGSNPGSFVRPWARQRAGKDRIASCGMC